MSDTKSCATCNTTFTRAEGVTPNNWALQKYCSVKCRQRNKASLDRARHEAKVAQKRHTDTWTDYNRRALGRWRDKHEATVRKVKFQRARVMESAG